MLPLLSLLACSDTPPGVDTHPGLFPLPARAAPGEDLDAWRPLETILEGADFVGFGEAEHGTRGLAELRGRATAWLVAEGGVRLVAQEASWNEALSIDAALQNCRTGIRDVPRPRSESLMWNEGNQPFLDWACAFNAAHPDDPVRVIGTDVQAPWHDVRVLRQVARTSEAVREALPGVARCHGAAHEDLEAFRTWAKDNDYPTPEPEDHAACVAALDRVDAALVETALNGPLAWQAPLAAKAIRSFDAFNQELLVRHEPYVAQDIRDQAQRHTLLVQRRALAPGARTVIWAHNAHVRSNGDAIDGRSFVSLGTLLARDDTVHYAAVGTVGYDVRTSFGEANDPPTPGPDTVEGTLHALSADAAIVVTDTWAGTRDGPSVMGRGERQDVPDQYAALLYLDHSPASRDVD